MPTPKAMDRIQSTEVNGNFDVVNEISGTVPCFYGLVAVQMGVNGATGPQFTVRGRISPTAPWADMEVITDEKPRLVSTVDGEPIPLQAIQAELTTLGAAGGSGGPKIWFVSV